MPSSELDLVLDALAGVLRDFGKHAFDLGRQDARRTQALFDQWAQHVLLGIEAPGKKGPVAALAQRHFPELRAFFQSHRKVEQQEVNAAQDALREVVWNFVASLNKVTAEDQQDDARVSTTLGKLAEAVVDRSGSQDVRALALEAIREVNAVLTSRKERQARQVAEMSARLESLGTQLEVARRESTTDGLTHLFNRRAFDDQLPRVSELARLKGCQAALLIIDLDHFKKVNDTWGHPAGDAVIRLLAQECVRAFKRKGDFVARYGGEEVVALLTDLKPVEAVAQADRLRGALAQAAIPWEGATLQVTCSVGVAAWKPDEAPEQWLARADAALYRAKAEGRNRVSLD